MLVTVIITFYSKDKGVLVKAVQSALAQTYYNINVIVIDDYSPVCAISELLNIKDPRLNIIKNDYNLGMAASINKAIELSSGDVIAFLDYDDIWFPFKIAEQIKLYKSESNEKCVIYSQASIISRGIEYIKPKSSIAYDDNITDYLFCKSGFIQTSGMMLSRNVALAVKMDLFKRHTDYQYCISLSNYGCYFKMLNKASYKHVVTPKLVDYNMSIDWLSKYEVYFTENSKMAFRNGVILRLIMKHHHYLTAFKYANENNITFINFIKAFFINFAIENLPQTIVSTFTKLKNI
ncbi:glycosyltransferase family 2 protein [Aeromonas caviae]|uniref:glycosyltransferase family 2 protein n=1 Tax=Aeromonas caviae TaxID=648 RepID=UPI002B48923F|nr:glycosyltransferase family 2 protein [Aeromonas caviae]